MTLRIGLSYRDTGSSDLNYERAMAAAAARAGVDVETFWLAGYDRPFDPDLASTMHAVVLTGGDDVEPAIYGAPVQGAHEPNRDRDRAEQRLLETVPELWEAPILAICRGHQLLNVMTSKEPDALIQDLQTGLNHVRIADIDARHEVAVRPDSMLASLIGTTATVNSSHHQAIGRLADEFSVAATAPDGTIEAYEFAQPDGRPWLLALQWHPERLDGPAGAGILDAFIAAAIARASTTSV